MEGQPEAFQPVSLFFAVKPGREDAARIYNWASEHRHRRGLEGNVLRAERLHITLMSVWVGSGPPPASVMNMACTIGAAVTCAAFKIVLDSAGSFARTNGKRPYVLLGEDGVVELRMLHRDLVGASLKFTDRERAFPRFTPHMTMLYDDRQLEACSIVPISWTAHELLLIESWIGLTRHVVRRRWRLTANGVASWQRASIF